MARCGLVLLHRNAGAGHWLETGWSRRHGRPLHLPSLMGIFIMVVWSLKPIPSRQGMAAAGLASVVLIAALITKTRFQVQVWSSTAPSSPMRSQ